MSKLYNVGAYIRLSIEDSVYDSASVENQREMLSKFIGMMPGWIEFKFYIDNGFSGATFQRPSFQEMMTDVRSGLVNLVLVKDLSRFGRNYLEAGRYLEEELPALGCRFVALSDNIDTEDGENDIMPFLNMMNDYHLKNLSDRIRSVMEAKARDGQKIAGNAPYGFWRDPDDHTRLVVDDYAAGVVRWIFDMRRQGKGLPTITKTLNSEGILPPKIYYLDKIGKDSSHIKSRSWIITTVQMILRREAYIGVAEQLSRTVISHRIKKEVNRPKDERIRLENAFPVIIDMDTWNAVSEVNRLAAEIYANAEWPRAERSLYSGLLVCADCGVTMPFRNSARKFVDGRRVGHANAQCRTFQSTGGTSCSMHTVAEGTLDRLVIGHIRRMAGQIVLDEDAVREILRRRLVGATVGSKANTKKEIKVLGADIHKLEVAISKLYEDWAGDIISEETFTDLIRKTEEERLEKERRLASLEQSKNEAAAKEADIDRWMRLIREYAGVEYVNRELLEGLVERIEIGEEYTEDGRKHQDIRIHYKFVGLW